MRAALGAVGKRKPRPVRKEKLEAALQVVQADMAAGSELLPVAGKNGFGEAGAVVVDGDLQRFWFWSIRQFYIYRILLYAGYVVYICIR